MGNKTFLGTVILAILDLFKRNWEGFFIKIWKKVPEKLQDELLIIVKVVENIKRVVEHPLTDIVTAVIPGDADEKMVTWLREILPELLERYNAASGIMPSDSYHNIATHLTKEFTGMSYGQSAVTIEMAYQNYRLSA